MLEKLFRVFPQKSFLEISGRSGPEIFLYKTLRADFAYLLTFRLAGSMSSKQVDWRGVIFQAWADFFGPDCPKNATEFAKKISIMRSKAQLNLALFISAL